MVENLPIYTVNIDGEDLGLYAVSLVDYPAIEEDFVYFKNQKPLGIYYFQGEKQEIVSPILIPDQLIYRIEGSYEYFIKWTAETIKQAFEKFKANGFLNRVTFMHETDICDVSYEDSMQEDVYMKEAWIVEDAETDKINTEYGYNLPKGTLCVHYKVLNESLWEKIKSGEVKGLSIEALAKLDRVEMKKQNKMKNKNILQKLIAFLNDIKDEVTDLEDIVDTDETDSGEAVVKYYLDETNYIEVNAEGFANDMDGELVAEGEYKLTDGNVLVVDAEGKFVETKAVEDAETVEPVEAPIAETEQKPTDEEEEETKEDETSEDETSEDENKEDETKEDDDEEQVEETSDDTETESTEDDTTDEDEDDLVELNIEGEVFKVPSKVADFIDRLANEKTDALAENVEMKKQIEKCKYTPSVKPITNTVMQNAVKEKSDEKVLLTDAFKRINHIA